MSVESWDPTAAERGSNYQLQREFLLNLIEQHRALSAPGAPNKDVRGYFPADELQTHSAMMTLGSEAWQQAIAGFDWGQLHSLIEILTLAEMQLPGFEAGAESPVIIIVKTLKQQKMPLGREMLLWIRSNSDNRFLPNGPL